MKRSGTGELLRYSIPVPPSRTRTLRTGLRDLVRLNTICTELRERPSCLRPRHRKGFAARRKTAEARNRECDEGGLCCTNGPVEPDQERKQDHGGEACEKTGAPGQQRWTCRVHHGRPNNEIHSP